MIRKIIHINEDKCNGCGLCATACHEGAIDIVDGKAKLAREHFCDGLGDCLPNCPTGAITFEEREAPAYDEEAVLKAQAQKASENQTTSYPHETSSSQGDKNLQNLHGAPISQNPSNTQAPPAGHPLGGGCPGSRIREMIRRNEESDTASTDTTSAKAATSQLRNWPVQIKLVPTSAPYFNGAKLLIAADCTAYSYASFHQEFMRGKVTLIGCPKLDAMDYSEKLTAIIANNNIESVTIVRMEVPCCGGLEMAAKKALQDSGKFIPWQVVTISIDGEILD